MTTDSKVKYTPDGQHARNPLMCVASVAHNAAYLIFGVVLEEMMQAKEKWYDTEDLPCPICGSKRIAAHSIQLSGDFDLFPSDLQINEIRYTRLSDGGKSMMEINAAWPTMIYPRAGADRNRSSMRWQCDNGHVFTTAFMRLPRTTP